MTEPAARDEIFHAALALATPQEREAYLDQVCRGDEALRAGIVRMIGAHHRAGRFLERPISDPGRVAALLDAALPSTDPAPDAPRGKVLPEGLLAPSQRADSLGRLGDMEVLEVVARGGMGLVLRAFDERLQREVAVKLLPPEVAANADSRRRFLREARRAASVLHENVIAIHAVDDAGRLPYLVMPYIDGRTLQERIRQGGPLPVEAILRLGAQIASGLAAVHARGLVHRDLKPANILIEGRGERVQISDFGVARALDDPNSTQAGLIAGTPAYMSPEQASGQPVDARSDLFSLGSVLYAMATGRPPFEGDTVIGVIRRVCDEPPRPLRERRPDLSGTLADLVARLHARAPADRPQSAAEVAAELAAQLGRLGAPVDAGSTRSATLRRERRPWFGPRAGVAAAACLLLAFALGAAESAGLTDLDGTVIRLLQPDGTLVVEVDDPAARVTLEGTDVVIIGVGTQEIRLKPGAYQLNTSRDGKVLRQELVTVSRKGRQLVRISREAAPAGEPGGPMGWEQLVAGLPPEAQVAAVVQRLQERNPGFDGKLQWWQHDGFIHQVRLNSPAVTDVTPLVALAKLRDVGLQRPPGGSGKAIDLAPLRRLPLTDLALVHQPGVDLTPLRGLPLGRLMLPDSGVADLSPLAGMPLVAIGLQGSRVSSLEPLRGMALKALDLYGSRAIREIGPLEGMPLTYLNLGHLPLSDPELTVIATLSELEWLCMEGVPIRDLSPLRSLRLTRVDLRGTKVEDLSPLRGMPLESIGLDDRPGRADFLRSFPALREINGKPAAEFWAEVEKTP